MLAGQAQKEVFVNEIAALCDALLHCAVKGAASAPPSAPVEGDCWIVAGGATGAWLGRDDALAAWIGGNWIFLAPRAGLRIYDLAARQERLFSDTWQAASAPATPSGGTMVDAQARSAIAEIYGILATVGMIPS